MSSFMMSTYMWTCSISTPQSTKNPPTIRNISTFPTVSAHPSDPPYHFPKLSVLDTYKAVLVTYPFSLITSAFPSHDYSLPFFQCQIFYVLFCTVICIIFTSLCKNLVKLTWVLAEAFRCPWQDQDGQNNNKIFWWSQPSFSIRREWMYVSIRQRWCH